MNIKVSIIVLTYNNLEHTTKPCVESILKNTPKDSYELILVDNASTDSTQSYLKETSLKNDHIKLCLNQTNRGYSGGNNDGIRMATGEIIILLNNDTLVPREWLESLVSPFNNNKDIGLVGPLTNSAGNEQRIDLEGLNETNYEEIIKPYLARHSGLIYKTQRLGFFCVAIRKEVIKQVGYLEERFGIGMFEDDDFCVRVLKKGFSIIIAESCFVYHKGSFSFNKLSSEKYRELFDKNKNLYENIHNIHWTFADIAFAYLEKLNTDLKRYQKNNSEISPDIENIIVRWHSFYHLLIQIELEKLKTSSVKKTAKLKKGQWNMRWHNFKTSFVSGSWNQRSKYVLHLLKKMKKLLFIFNNKS